jgi:hypothetical protein
MLNKLSKFLMRVSAGIKRRRIHNACQGTHKFAHMAVAFLFVLLAAHAFAQSEKDIRIKFVNVADSTQGLADFSQFPAINNRGAVAFVATQNGSDQVFKSERHDLRTIASTTDSIFTFFADNVAINAAGIVAFQAGLNTGGRASGIFTSDGFATKTIVNSTEQGLPGFGLGAPSINASGTVAFFAPRNGFRSTIIFTGNGGALTPVLDTLTSNFGSFGAVAINARGEIVFRGIHKDRSEGIFLAIPSSDQKGKNEGSSAGPVSVVGLTDTSNFAFFGFGDPVINDAGIVADAAGGAGQVEILSGDAKGITARTDPSSQFFIDFEHPSINNRGAVAFSAFEANGGQGIFVELTGGASPVAVLQTGDLLFGSTVTAVSVGRFAFNDHFRLAFEYELADGRSGIAVASLHTDDEDQEEK